MKPLLVLHRDMIGPLPGRRTLLGWAWSFAAVVCAVQTAHARGPDPAAFNGFDVANASVPLNAIQRGGPPKDGIPAIDRPKFLPASQAGLGDGERILGLALEGVARAYPVRILNWHEVVNDRVGDRAVTVTYCPLCGTGMAFDARLPAGPASFGVSGLLYNSDVLLYDRATQSLWSQMLETAISGPLKGTRLKSVALTHTSWADWRRRHPDTQVLSTDTGFERDYSRDPYAGYDRVQRLMFDVQHRDDRFPLKEWVLGIQVNGVQKAYPFSVLVRTVDASGELTDVVAGRRFLIRYDRTHGTAEAFDAQGRAWPGTMAFWFAWVAFHPRTEVLSR
ncbi:DUF3179 domain-containing protein [Piscinibacter sp.]|uniref:DUF3179 domain-containing protein n=1 Tax=Piscinibacter sp. TaxID=1903157 RepID=UPI002C70D26F|nr:DUF3179 domain-containing protein [Albitalea sp.]HUG25497.1 DUF3179 domain-containing protein [Albitalea sp.]